MLARVLVAGQVRVAMYAQDLSHELTEIDLGQLTRTLRRGGWRVLRIWEHELGRKNEARLLRRIARALAVQPESEAPDRPVAPKQH